MSKENLLNLFKEKKYSKIIFLIEQIENDKRTPSLYNLLGVCRMLSINSNESVKFAIDDFKKSYFLEKDKTKTKETLKNLINASVTFFDNETKNKTELGNEFFKELKLIYNENQELFDNDLDLAKGILKVLKRSSDVKNIIYYLNKITNKFSDADLVASYNFFNNYIYDWQQNDYYNNSIKINDKLPYYAIR